MTRVLFVNHSTVIGGAETNLLNIIRYSRDGDFCPVGVLLPDDGPLSKEVRSLGVPVSLIAYHAFHWRNPLRYAQTLGQLILAIRRSGADVVHLNHQWLVEYIVLAGRLTRTPVICHVRNYLDAGIVTDNRTWLLRATVIAVVSQAVGQSLHSLDLLGTKLRLVYDGIDCYRFCKSDQERNSSTPVSARLPVIGFCGRIVPEKGPEELIAAIPLVLDRYPLARFVFAGVDQEGGEYIKQLERKAEALGVSEQVEFIGFRPDIENVLARLDVLTLPSRPSMREGLPLSALEGLASGCMVVATPNSGIPEAIQDGRTGFLVEPEHPAKLAEAITKALKLTDQERVAIRNAARDLVNKKFSIHAQVTQLGKLYRELSR